MQHLTNSTYPNRYKGYTLVGEITVTTIQKGIEGIERMKGIGRRYGYTTFKTYYPQHSDIGGTVPLYGKK
jgi:hypothetical protein